MLLKIILGFFLIAFIETLNGIFRVYILKKKLGAKKSNIFSFIFGSLFVFILNIILVPWIAPQNIPESILIGAIWMSLMVFYDLYIGRVLFKLSWTKIFEDFNIFKGNLMGIGMLFIFFLPLIVFTYFM